MSELTVGLDGGARGHGVCVVDASGRVPARWRVPHDREGLERLLRDLRRLAEPSSSPVAIERPSGLLVDTLMDAGPPVIAIHPNIVKATRARYRASNSRRDDADAFPLADLLRTDAHRFTPVRTAATRCAPYAPSPAPATTCCGSASCPPTNPAPTSTPTTSAAAPPATPPSPRQGVDTGCLIGPSPQRGPPGGAGCFTWNTPRHHADVSRGTSGRAFRCTSSAAMSESRTPRMRWAAPSVAGRPRSRAERPSAERLGTRA
jgi:hypothetical protein